MNFEAPIFVVLVLLSSAAVAGPVSALGAPRQGVRGHPRLAVRQALPTGPPVCGRVQLHKGCDGCSRSKAPYAYCACKKPPAPFLRPAVTPGSDTELPEWM